MGGPGYTPAELDDGSVAQSAVHSSGDPDDGHDDMAGYVTRAVVLKVYYTDDPTWQSRGWAASSMRALACDVRTYGRSGTRPLYHVPVCQRVAGLFDEDTYVPRESRQDIDGAPLIGVGAPKPAPAPTRAELMDGDHVLIGFVENDPHQPIVLPYCLPHPSSKNPPTMINGRRRRIRFNGSYLEIDKQGNITLDGSEAANDILGPGGTEVPNPALGGTIKLQTKTTLAATIKIQLDAASGEASIDAPVVKLSDTPTDGVIKGTTFKDALYVVLKAIAAATTPPTTAAVTTFEETEALWLSTKVTTG
jgi:hypothetical protein